MRVCSGWRRLLLLLPVIFLFPHIISVLELHRDSTAEHRHQSQTKKFDHLVFGPAAGEGLHDRLQCQGTKALNKTHFSSSLRNSNFGDGISFVTVFTTYNSTADSFIKSRSSEQVSVGNMSYNKAERSMAVLDVFINFIEVTMPQSNVFILTDPASTLPVQRKGVTLYPSQGEYSRDKLMLQRIRSYIVFLQQKLEEESQLQGRISHYIFTDSDVAVVDDLGQIFKDYPLFDLALTFRNNKEQPLNSGFIAVRGSRDGIQRAKVFLQEVLEVYTSKYMKASRMLGDQLALAWVVKSHPSFNTKKFARPQPFEEKIKGASLLFLPCAIYNWTPPEGAGQFHGMPLDVRKKVAILTTAITLLFVICATTSALVFDEHHHRKILIGSIGLVASVAMYCSPLVVVFALAGIWTTEPRLLSCVTKPDWLSFRDPAACALFQVKKEGNHGRTSEMGCGKG